MRELMSYLPERYESSPEMVAIQQAIEPELKFAWGKRDDLLLQLDPHTATWGLALWEEAFGLPTDDTLAIGLRRTRVIARIRGMGTTTVPRLKSVVETFCPGCEVSIVEHYTKYLVEIRLTITNQAVEDNDGLEEMLDLIMPEHLAWGFSITVETEGAITFGTASEMAGKMDVWPLVVREIESTGAVTYGVGSELAEHMKVFPLAAKKIVATGEAVAASALNCGMTIEIYPQGGTAHG